MVTKLVPLNPRKAREESLGSVKNYTIVGAHGNTRDDGLLSNNLFSLPWLHDDYAIHYVRDMLMSYIELCKPVLNPVISGSEYYTLARILGKKSGDISDVMSGKKVLDLNTDELIQPVNATKEQNLLYGAEIVEMWLEGFNWEKRMLEVLYSTLKENLFTPSHNIENYIVISKGEGNIHIFADYYGELLEDGYEFSDRLSTARIHSVIDKEVSTKRNSSITLLSVLKGRNLRDIFIMNIVRVSPPGIRPGIAQGQDPMSILFSNIVMASNSLGKEIGKASPVVISTKYLELQKSVYNIMIDASSKGPQYHSVIKAFSNKKALVRGKMEGKRVDFSGRSSIVVAPDCSIDEVYLPKEMFDVIMSFHLKYSNNLLSVKDILENVPIMLNRAPTLHRLGIQGFYVRLWDEQAIGLHPLVCEAYNADFDGDQMAVHVPLSQKAISEVLNLMMSTRNLYKPSSGMTNHSPKQEIMYGLNYLTKDALPNLSKGASYEDFESVLEAYKMQEIHVQELITFKGEKMTAGRAVIRHIFPKRIWKDVESIEKGNVKEIIMKLSHTTLSNIKEYVDTMNRMVEYGCLTATLYPPNITIFGDVKIRTASGVSTPKTLFDTFEEQLRPYREAYLNGFESRQSYNTTYQNLIKKLDMEVEKNIVEDCLDVSGFAVLTKSGAKGSANTLKQILLYKGQVESAPGRPFAIVLKNGCKAQLTPFEHTIAAIGARRSLIDRSIKPGETGEATRLMKHTTEDMIIRREDCGTSRGINITYEDINRFSKSGEMRLKDTLDIARDMILGRFLVNGTFIDHDNVEAVLGGLREGIMIRSPITCEDPCCYKCYGVDLTYRRKAVNGLPIGTIASQAIGEPGTQMTMKTFQKGGVVTDADMTSDFQKIKTIINNIKITPGMPSWDPVAWADGKIVSTVDGYTKIITIEGAEGQVEVNLYADIKDTVVKGQGLCRFQGDLNIDDIVNLKSVEEAAMYIVYKLYFIYRDQASVNIKHMEVLASSMMAFIVTEGSKEFRTGLVMSRRQYYSRKAYMDTNIRGVWRIFGVTDMPRLLESFMSGIGFRYVSECISQAVLKGKEEDFTSSTCRVMLGRAPITGMAYNPEYINERNSEEHKLPLI